jgi:PhzF family phenazine biosynthesis protein
MQTVAHEINQAETAFCWTREGGDWELRWFTPVCEIDLCGHATLATAHILSTTGRNSLPVTFWTNSGALIVEAKVDGYSMDFPARPAHEVVDLSVMSEVLGVPVLEARCNASAFLARLESEHAVRAVQPNIPKIAALGKIGLIITAPGTECDFVSRFFAPNYGVNEDPATGSAHCALAPFWSPIFGRSTMIGHQLSPRGGQIGVTLLDDRVLLSGAARTFLEGTIL